jgi:hypothetical protein
MCNTGHMEKAVRQAWPDQRIGPSRRKRKHRHGLFPLISLLRGAIQSVLRVIETLILMVRRYCCCCNDPEEDDEKLEDILVSHVAWGLSKRIKTPHPDHMGEPLMLGFQDGPPGNGVQWVAKPAKGCVYACTSILYGSAHILGWNLVFPTPAERVMWQVTTLLVTCIGPFAFLFQNIFNGRIIGCCILFCIFSFPTLLPIYTLVEACGVVFLPVESMRQLFFLERPAYDLPAWAKYVPHWS